MKPRPLDRVAAASANVRGFGQGRTYKTIKTWFCRFCRCPYAGFAIIRIREEAALSCCLQQASRSTPASGGRATEDVQVVCAAGRGDQRGRLPITPEREPICVEAQ